MWLPERERTLTAVTQEKTLFLFFDLFCRFFWIPRLPATTSVVVVYFIGTKKSNLAFELFFSSVTFFTVVKNLCLYVGLLQFCGVFLFSFSLFFNFNFLNLLFFSTLIFLFAFPTVLFPLQLLFNVYKSSLATCI